MVSKTITGVISKQGEEKTLGVVMGTGTSTVVMSDELMITGVTASRDQHCRCFLSSFSRTTGVIDFGKHQYVDHGREGLPQA